MSESLSRRCAAEVLGTFWLVFGGCGAAVLAATFPAIGIGANGVALAFGVAVLGMAYAVGPISGAHLNPAVSFAAWMTRRMTTRDFGGYVLAQLGGATLASGVLYLIANGRPGFSVAAGFATNGYGSASPGGYGLGAAFLAELVLTAAFVFVILAVTAPGRPVGSAPVAIGLTLTLVHLVGIPVTNVSVNPARSTGPALVASGEAIGQLWVFWVAPILGAGLAALGHVLLFGASGRAALRFPAFRAHAEAR